jgi:hypothetical protein
MTSPTRWTAIALACLCLSLAGARPEEHEPFAIRVVDAATGRGVPLVELTTVHGVTYCTDSAGIVAFDEPGLMDQAVFFHVRSHGYAYAQDGFGYRGARLTITPGGAATLKLERINIAERLYRVTGAGIYRDSVLVGEDAPTARPTLNGQVLGSDSVVNAVYRGKLFWFWGDTHRPAYPLGNFHVPGAVSLLPGDGGLDPELGVDLEYFVDDEGCARPTARMPGEGPTWINGLVTLEDGAGRERLFAAYVKVEAPLKIYERGLAVFDDETAQFEKLVELDMRAPLFPSGHPFKCEDGGVEYVYFADPFPLVRVRATPEDLCDPSKYEAYTCLKRGSRAGARDVERLGGAPCFGWKTDTLPFTAELQARLIEEGRLEPAEAPLRLTDDAGRPILMHRGSVYWNEYRARWILIGVESFGTSPLGEIWYAEAPQPVGPWANARKIVTHDRYSFYNPKQHPMFDKDGGRVIFFEGTYTSMFSGNDVKTPRYDYNQIMYKLDLSEPRLRLPAD